MGGVWSAWWSIVADWRYLACLPALMLVELLAPARPRPRDQRAALAQDATWFVLSSLLGVTVVAGYLAVLSRGVDALSRSWRPDAVPVIGTVGAALLALVVGDLAQWYSHRLHHRVALLWSFHVVHHSQTAMNVLSDNRQHVVETLVTATFTFLPARLLGLDAAGAGTLTIITLVISAFIHANIRTDLGPLRFVLISPQAHRVHHSTDPGHFDTNYGTVFAWWDYLFGTRHPDRHIYPDTGIEDPAFPLEQRSNPIALRAHLGRAGGVPVHCARVAASASRARRVRSPQHRRPDRLPVGAAVSVAGVDRGHGREATRATRDLRARSTRGSR